VTSQVIKDDGNESTMDDHLSDDNRKGTRGMSEERTSDVHRNPQQRRPEPTPTPGQPQPGKDRDKDMPGEDPDPAHPSRKDTKPNPKRK
jgi:hypothetical protein